MSYSIKGTTITLTRGDTLIAEIGMTNPDKTPYEPAEGDTVRFAMKSTFDDPEPLLVKQIPTDTMILRIDHEDTAGLAFGKYVYDVQLTMADGTVDTFITKAELRLTEEVC